MHAAIIISDMAIRPDPDKNIAASNTIAAQMPICTRGKSIALIHQILLSENGRTVTTATASAAIQQIMLYITKNDGIRLSFAVPPSTALTGSIRL